MSNDKTLSGEFSVVAKGRTTKRTFNLAKVTNLSTLTKLIAMTGSAQDKVNDLIQMAAIGSAYWILDRGNTTPLKQLLENLRVTALQVKRLHAYITRLTGGMVEITESGRGKDKKVTVKYKYDPAVKDDLLAGHDDMSKTFEIEKTKYFEMCHELWTDEEIKPKEPKEFNLSSWTSSFKKSITKATVEGKLPLEAIMQIVKDTYSDARSEMNTINLEQLKAAGFEIETTSIPDPLLPEDAAKIKDELEVLATQTTDPETLEYINEFKDALSNGKVKTNCYAYYELKTLKEEMGIDCDQDQTQDESKQDESKQDESKQDEQEINVPKKIKELNNLEAENAFKEMIKTGVLRRTATNRTMSKYSNK